MLHERDLPGMVIGPAFPFKQFSLVRRMSEDLVFAVGSFVGCDLLASIINTNSLIICPERNNHPHQCPRHGVLVGLVDEVELRRYVLGKDFIGVKRMRVESEQVRFFLMLENEFGNPSCCTVLALIGGMTEPLRTLSLKIRKVSELSARPEAGTDVLDSVLNTALFIS